MRNLPALVFWRNFMRRSQYVAAPILTSAALAMLTGCRSPEMQRCVDANNVVVTDNLCQGQQGSHYYGGGSGGYYRWYYGGRGGYVSGSVATGGGESPASGHSYSTSPSRGGFGSTHSGGEGGGE